MCHFKEIEIGFIYIIFFRIGSKTGRANIFLEIVAGQWSDSGRIVVGYWVGGIGCGGVGVQENMKGT